MDEAAKSNEETRDAPKGFSLLLVVEDDLTAKRLEEILARPEGTRFETTRVLRVEEALLRLHADRFDAMLIDLSVHEADGLDSLMRASAAASAVPIVVLTYQRDEETGLRATRAGAQDYLAKGEVTPELLTRTLIHAIERHRTLQALTQAKRKHQFLATHDTLTELPNRYWFMDQLDRLLARSQRSNTPIAVFFIDLDGFKAINDNLGHAIGDELLGDVAKRLRSSIRKNDLVARIGGDEFLAAIQGIEDEEEAFTTADVIRQAVERPYHLDGNECWISASIGIAIHPQHGEDGESLIQSADAAMYEAKNSGKNCIHMYNTELNEKAAERFEMVNGLRQAVLSGQLFLEFQPQIEVATESIVGVETLVRWEHPTRGSISPADFIPVAEETGGMVQLGEWVLRAACQAAMGWEGLNDARVAVNISGRQIHHHDFLSHLDRVLDETGIAPTRLELELTESLAASEEAVQVLDQIRERGIRVAIDDFGTGYSSLTLLRRLNVDLLKIDQSFVRGAAQTDPDGVILEGIIHIARGLGIDLIAEGVETVEEMRCLLERGCSRMQGYLFSKPVTRHELVHLATDPEAAWRIPIVDPESWSPELSQRSIQTQTRRGGARSGSLHDPDEHLYPVLKD
ncbi:MAG: EAL domain-containing protein [bacterium]|nr:EAL domain-containing protein [bacterium]